MKDINTEIENEKEKTKGSINKGDAAMPGAQEETVPVRAVELCEMDLVVTTLSFKYFFTFYRNRSFFQS